MRNIQSDRVFYADSFDTVFVVLPHFDGGVDTKIPFRGSPYLGPVSRKPLTFFLKFIKQAQRLSLPGTFLF